MTELPTRTLPGGLALTELGLGTSQLGNLYHETTEDEAAAAVTTAWDGGIRYFDTAPHYGVGLSERRLGRLLTAYPRDDFVLSTKVGRLLTPHPGAQGTDTEGFAVPRTWQRAWDLSRDGIRRSIEDSLQRLGLDRIDIAYLHDPDDFVDDALRTALPALIELRDEGILRAVGAGMNHTAPLVRFVRELDIDVVMVAGRLTLLDQSAADELLPAAQENNVGIVAAGVYNSGLLSSPRPSAGAKFDYGDATPEVLTRAVKMADEIEERGADLPSTAVHYPLRSSTVASVVVGARNADQVSALLSRYHATIPREVWDAPSLNSL